MKTKEKKYLSELTLAVSTALRELDKVMREPAGERRGREVAKISNWLNLHNDAAMHFGLDYSFAKILDVNKIARRLMRNDMLRCFYIDNVGGCCKTVGHKPCKCKEQVKILRLQLSSLKEQL
ncbi:MAG: hypothetical protein HQK96_17785 [Nitrospirae bacterium]|nr:hypothetical protein [Nitrospirota bacterium]